MSFIGNTPAESYSTVVKDTFSGNDSDTDFTLSIPATTNSVEVLVENVQQEPTTAYTISGTTLTFTAAPVTGTNNIYVIHRGPAVQQVVPPAGVAIDASTVTASGDVSIADKIVHTGDTNTAIRFPAADTVTVETGGSERVRVDSSGNVGIGTSPVTLKSATTLQVDGNAKLGDDNGRGLLSLGDIASTGANAGIWRGAAGAYAGTGNYLNLGGYDGITFTTGTADIASQTERMRIDSGGSVGFKTTNPSGNLTGDGANFAFSSGNFNALVLSKYSTSFGTALYVHRSFDVGDGTLIEFAQDTSTEGTISVSGTAVSYNGGHLSRWSRLADDSKDTSIVKGTVMTNLDEMVEWSHPAVEAQDAVYETVTIPAEYDEDGNEITPETTEERLVSEAIEAKDAYTEDNEQLNKMAVSSMEGDPNVAGVFVNWDESDDFNDMNIAMTGDMVIRIAQGTTVQRGDLLMSAGDGTAKPQGDDIVRSKTIAKVTSTHVSHTYDDGSYLVPCVLMAC